MNINIFRPGKAVESAFENPNILLALALVLLPSLASIAGRMAYGIDATGNAIYEIALAYITFFVLLLVVFALGLILDAKKTKGKFVSVFSALSLIQVTQLLIIVVSFLVVPLVFSPETIAFAIQASQASDTGMATLQLTEYVSETPGAVNVPILGFVAIAGTAIALLGMYILYLCIKKLTETRTITAAMLTLVALVILGLLPI